MSHMSYHMEKFLVFFSPRHIPHVFFNLIDQKQYVIVDLLRTLQENFAYKA